MERTNQAPYVHFFQASLIFHFLSSSMFLFGLSLDQIAKGMITMKKHEI